MQLTLTLSPTSVGVADQQVSKVFDTLGGTVGRSSDNDLVLVGKDVSRRHCAIQFRDDHFIVLDTSTNGLLLNDKKLGTNNESVLRDGDALIIGPYRFDVSIRARDVASVWEADEQPNEGTFTFSPPGRRGVRRAAPDPFADPLDMSPEESSLIGRRSAREEAYRSVRDAEDPFSVPGEAVTPSSRAWPEDDPWAPRPATANRPPPQQDHFKPPRPAPARPTRPAVPAEAWDDPPPVPTPARPKPARSRGDEVRRPAVDRSLEAGEDMALLRAFLAGARLDISQVPESVAPAELMRLVGELFRVLVVGLHENLKARAVAKGEFRLEQTVVRRSRNNPLKVSTTPEAALKIILFDGGHEYLSAREAVEEGFSDIEAHQMALVAGMQAALDQLLRQFDPNDLKRRLENIGLVEAIIPSKKKAKYWELYQDFYKTILRQAEQGFHEVFGKEFGRAYEDQVRKLR